MNEDSIEVLAERAGLRSAFQQFREDVIAAIEDAEQLRLALNSSPKAAAEPWPPMRVDRRP
jgi:hypothetical protein